MGSNSIFQLYTSIVNEGPDEETKKILIARGLMPADPVVEQLKQSVETKNETPDSIFHNLYYLHNTETNYRKHQKK